MYCQLEYVHMQEHVVSMYCTKYKDSEHVEYIQCIEILSSPILVHYFLFNLIHLT